MTYFQWLTNEALAKKEGEDLSTYIPQYINKTIVKNQTIPFLLRSKQSSRYLVLVTEPRANASD